MNVQQRTAVLNMWPMDPWGHPAETYGNGRVIIIMLRCFCLFLCAESGTDGAKAAAGHTVGRLGLDPQLPWYLVYWHAPHHGNQRWFLLRRVPGTVVKVSFIKLSPGYRPCDE